MFESYTSYYIYIYINYSIYYAFSLLSPLVYLFLYLNYNPFPNHGSHLLIPLWQPPWPIPMGIRFGRFEVMDAEEKTGIGRSER